MLNLRDYQSRGIDKLRDGFINGHRIQLLYAPCGAGKTEIAISLLKATADKGNNVAMVMDRRVLCDQTSARLDKYGIDHGVLMADHWRYRPDKRIQICSAQTLEARGSFPGMSLLIIDECHTQRKAMKELAKSMRGLRVIGLSASPFTKGLGEIYSNIVNVTTTRELVDAGNLCPLRVFIAKEIDMEGAKKVAGEWSDKEASERGIKIVGDVVSEWVKKTHEIFGEPKKSICFAAGVAHGEELSRKFTESGYNFISLSYRDDEEYKKQVFEEFARPDSSIHGLIATDILTKGFDQADVFIGISARPFSKSFSSHVQQLGRVMRPHHEKSDAIWLDHSGNFLRFQDQWQELYGSGVSELDKITDKAVKEPTKKEKEAAKCPACGALWGGGDICKHCGMVRVRRNDVQVKSGEMVELGGDAPKKEKYDSATKERWYQELLMYAKVHGYKDGWAYHKYIDKFGIAPAWKKQTAPTTHDVYNWITSQNIRRAYSAVR